MKLFKNTLFIMTLITISSLDGYNPSARKSQPAKSAPAKRTRSTATTTKSTSKRSTPARTKRAAQKEQVAQEEEVIQEEQAPTAQTYQEIRSYIISQPRAKIINSETGLLQPEFIEDITALVKSSNLKMVGLEALLKTARDNFAPFTNDNDKNIAIISGIEGQIKKATDKFYQ